jgi:hypothetical protein
MAKDGSPDVAGPRRSDPGNDPLAAFRERLLDREDDIALLTLRAEPVPLDAGLVASGHGPN